MASAVESASGSAGGVAPLRYLLTTITVNPAAANPSTANVATPVNVPEPMSAPPIAGPIARPTAMDDWVSPTRSSGTRDHFAIDSRIRGVAIQKQNPHITNPIPNRAALFENPTAIAHRPVPSTHMPPDPPFGNTLAAMNPARALAENANGTNSDATPMAEPLVAEYKKQSRTGCGHDTHRHYEHDIGSGGAHPPANMAVPGELSRQKHARDGNDAK